tara:strand:+ start:584 stop:1018 length:435 start_codon:yes stop_codon:yes gene_type:complete
MADEADWKSKYEEQRKMKIAYSDELTKQSIFLTEQSKAFIETKKALADTKEALAEQRKTNHFYQRNLRTLETRNQELIKENNALKLENAKDVARCQFLRKENNALKLENQTLKSLSKKLQNRLAFDDWEREPQPLNGYMVTLNT